MSHGPHQVGASPSFPIIGLDLIPNSALSLSLEVTVQDSASRDERLNRAVNTLIPAALERKQGIAVIQRDYGKYTVSVHERVPCGTIRESRQ